MGIELAILAAVVVVLLALGALRLSMSRLRRLAVRGAPAPSPAEEARPIPAAEGLAGRIRALFRGGQATEEAWRGLEEALVRADVGPKAAAELVGRVRAAYRPPEDPAEVVIREVAQTFAGDLPWSAPAGNPGIVLVVGVNGTGKTTTIGKLAHLLAKEGLSVSLANSDTFRAAAGEQLETWAIRAGAQVIAQERGADPAAVAFDAVQAARARGSDVLIVDTAGRLHTRRPLMAELAKVRRVVERAAGRPPDEVLLVLDATTGQNGIAQARAFAEAVEVTGVVLAKMDGTARGGIVLSVREELGVPVKLMGTGEGPFDLVPFDPEQFARRLVA